MNSKPSLMPLVSTASPANPKPSPKTLIGQSPAAQTQSDPLIAKGAQKAIYLGSAAVLLIALVIVGFFSRRVEYLIVIGLVLSLMLICFFLL